MPMRGFSQIYRENLLSHSTEKLCRRTFLRFKKFVVSKNITDKRVRGGKEYHVNLSFFLPHSTEKLRRGTFLFFKKTFWYRKTSWVRGRE